MSETSTTTNVSSSGSGKYHKSLLDAQIAFDRGDYASVRAQVKPLLADGSPPDVQRDATELLRRIGTDKPAIYLAVGCLIFFAVVVAQYVL